MGTCPVTFAYANDTPYDCIFQGLMLFFVHSIPLSSANALDSTFDRCYIDSHNLIPTDEARRKKPQWLAEGAKLSGYPNGDRTVRGCDSGEARSAGAEGARRASANLSGKRTEEKVALLLRRFRVAQWSVLWTMTGPRICFRGPFSVR